MVGLRYSDLCRIKKPHLEQRDGQTYLKMLSKKTNTDTLVKLPAQALEIFEKYKKRKTTLLPTVSLFRFNSNLKKIGALAGWTQPVNRTSTTPATGISPQVRFCDTLSSHCMRRTSITTMLTSGMPEYIVRKISGHTSDSKAFYRYVSLAQSLMDKEIDKMHAHFQIPTGLNAV